MIVVKLYQDVVKTYVAAIKTDCAEYRNSYR
jgi:hypothetical protein